MHISQAASDCPLAQPREQCPASKSASSEITGRGKAAVQACFMIDVLLLGAFTDKAVEK